MKETIKKMIREGVTGDDKITKISIFDFDGTLINTATPDTGKLIWKEKTGQDWPHIGWWSKKESLDSTVFDNSTISSVVNAYKVESVNPNTLTIMMTGRIPRLSNEVESILTSNGLKFDKYLYNNSSDTLKFKLGKLDSLITQYPNLKVIELWEDREPHVIAFREWGDSHPNIRVKVNQVK
jgi:hypothetical protein